MGDGDESADVEVIDVMQHLRVGVRIAGCEAAVISGEKKLTDFFFEGHFAKGGLDPFLLFARE